MLRTGTVATLPVTSVVVPVAKVLAVAEIEVELCRGNGTLGVAVEIPVPPLAHGVCVPRIVAATVPTGPTVELVRGKGGGDTGENVLGGLASPPVSAEREFELRDVNGRIVREEVLLETLVLTIIPKLREKDVEFREAATPVGKIEKGVAYPPVPTATVPSLPVEGARAVELGSGYGGEVEFPYSLLDETLTETRPVDNGKGLTVMPGMLLVKETRLLSVSEPDNTEELTAVE